MDLKNKVGEVVKVIIIIGKVILRSLGEAGGDAVNGDIGW